ncbi:hypothetical protein MPRF_08460 [Mycolicibacterium parafortuitum]|uniref:Uncharacterized protein n=1 Tax=Mycolicibacterium parafortuitum TaxID=39692 RepID=A0A7I7TXJ6_MYCPF|nr:hypothetical protein [Mycolicibacterium parafortuitum]PQE01458.1 hypothetical protein CYL16_05095 [Mycobacterium sp. EPG1]BBY73947.1 hypothetical protein MPRF_08460 [Mycolicibacterium parafortuitum]
MIAFWIAVVVGGIVGVIYVTLGVQAFFRVRRDVLALAESGAAAEIDTAGLEQENNRSFTWKALAAVVTSTAVIVLLGVSPVFWYIPAVLAIGSAVAVIAAFVIDRKAAA